MFEEDEAILTNMVGHFLDPKLPSSIFELCLDVEDTFILRHTP